MVLQHVEIFLHMSSLQILQFYLSRGVQLKNELGIKCREVGFYRYYNFSVLGQDVVILNGPLLSLNRPYICLC